MYDKKPIEKQFKIVVSGSFSSGKTSFIKTISEIGVSWTGSQTAKQEFAVLNQDEASSIAMDFGRFTIDNNDILYFFATPGARRFDFMWEILAEGLIGIVITVDSTMPTTFRECKSIIETMKAYAPVPIVIAANKQDKAGAWDVEDIRIALKLTPNMLVMSCIATDKQSVANVLIKLCEKVLEEIDRVEQDVH